MRRVIFESSVSLDGFIKHPFSGPGGARNGVTREDSVNVLNFLSCFDTIFFGRKTYEKVAAFDIREERLTRRGKEVLAMLHGMRKYVFSRTMKHVPGNAMVVSANLREEVLRIRDETGKHIWLWCGADLLQTFMGLDLVDDYILSVDPVRLHCGQPLFQGNKRPVNLILVSREDRASGLVVLHYKPENRFNSRGYDDRSI